MGAKLTRELVGPFDGPLTLSVLLIEKKVDV